MFWWEREGCCVRRGEEGNKKKERGIEKEEKELLDFRCSQENKKSEKTFGQQNQIRDVDLGWVRVMLGKKISHPLFQLMTITLFTTYKLIILERPKEWYNFAYTYTYIYIYIYILTLIKLSITLKEHIYSIISQKSKLHALKK